MDDCVVTKVMKVDCVQEYKRTSEKHTKNCKSFSMNKIKKCTDRDNPQIVVYSLFLYPQFPITKSTKLQDLYSKIDYSKKSLSEAINKPQVESEQMHLLNLLPSKLRLVYLTTGLHLGTLERGVCILRLSVPLLQHYNY